MYLEKLKIQGFKSFANKNELKFPGMISGDRRGITCVVGPNGSGKSNVADAVRWVLGEQSMKTLRGKKAEDIIFSGSDKKARLGMAEVSLYLNNEDKSAPIEFSQVVISRRLYRDGNSEYMINNNRVRLADIQLLLAKASCGQKTYSVIGQGMVEGFLSTSLSERKEFFDEATGVRQFQLKRDDALNKLKNSLDNLGQAEMLIVEIEPRLKTLTRQVEKIQKREELEKELEGLQLNYYRKSWHDLNDRLAESNKKYLELEKEKTDKDRKIESLNRDLDAIKQERTVNEEFDSLQENLNKLQFRKNGLFGQLNKIENWLNIKAENVDELDTKSLEAEKDELAKNILLTEEEISKLNSSRDNTERGNELRSEIRNLISEKEDLIRQSNKLNAWLEMKLESIGQFDLSFLNNRKVEIQKEVGELEEEEERSRESVVKVENELSRLEIEKNDFIEKIRIFNQELNQLKSVGNKNIVREVNERLQKALDRLTEAEREMDISKVRASLFVIKEELKKVLDFSTGQEAQKKIEGIQNDLNLYSTKREETIDKINEFRLEINTKNEKIRLGANKIAQLEMELRDTNKKLEKSQEKFDSSSVKKEIEEVKSKINPIEEKIAKTKELVLEVNGKEEEDRNKLFELRKDLQEKQHEVNRINNALNEYRVSSAKHETRLEDIESALKRGGFVGEINGESIKTRRTEVSATIREVDEKINSDKEKINKFNQAQESKRNHLLKLQRDLQVLQNEVNILNNSLNEIRVNSARHETRLEDLERDIRVVFEGLRKIKGERFGGEIDMDAVWSRIGQIKRQLDQIGGIDPEVELEYKETKERFDFLSGQSGDLNNTIGSLEEIVKELDATIKEKFDKEFKIISEKFEEYFKILFNGGKAKIVKVMAEDKPAKSEDGVLVPAISKQDESMKRIKFLQKHNSTGLAGIEINACPPGKKIASISMLSGGERALTAIALICAIISANPSPFVLLDEVDAALDEANSERLVRILEDLAHKTQFIVITHNRAPMRKANFLYGVTMGDDGISKLLSVKLDEIIKK